MLRRYKYVERTCNFSWSWICFKILLLVVITKTQNFFEEFNSCQRPTLKMTTRSQKRKAIAELASGDFEASLAENNSTENLIPSSSKNPRLELENLEEIKTTLRKEIMTDLTKILAENQKEMLKLIAPASKKRSANSNLQDSDSDQENISVARTSTPVKTQTATSSKTTPNNSRNNFFFLNYIHWIFSNEIFTITS